MKKYLIIAFFTTLMLSSCEDGLLNDTNDPRDKIVDSWKCDESNSLKSLTEIYGVDIEKSLTDSTKILLVNFYNLGDEIEAEAILDGKIITIPTPQELPGGYTITSGSGTILNNYTQIDWIYKIDDGSGILDNVTAEYTKF